MGAPQAPANVVRILGPFQVLRELGSRAVPTFVARPLETPADVVVLQCFPDDDLGASAERDAAAALGVQHPNLASRVRCSTADGGQRLVTSDFVEGESLDDLQRLAREQGESMPTGVVLRVCVDVLTGIQWLHQVNRASPQPIKPFHGQICAREVLVGIDGVARVTNVVRMHLADDVRRAPELEGYAAPEALTEGTADGRSDVYAVGAMLRSGLGTTKEPWEEALADVALRALSPEAKSRFANPAEMLAQLRKAAGEHIASNATVGEFVERLAGDRVRRRRDELQLPPPPAREPGPSSQVRARPGEMRGGIVPIAMYDSDPPDPPTDIAIPMTVDPATTETVTAAGPLPDDDGEETTHNAVKQTDENDAGVDDPTLTEPSVTTGLLAPPLAMKAPGEDPDDRTQVDVDDETRPDPSITAIAPVTSGTPGFGGRVFERFDDESSTTTLPAPTQPNAPPGPHPHGIVVPPPQPIVGSVYSEPFPAPPPPFELPHWRAQPTLPPLPPEEEPSGNGRRFLAALLIVGALAVLVYASFRFVRARAAHPIDPAASAPLVAASDSAPFDVASAAPADSTATPPGSASAAAASVSASPPASASGSSTKAAAPGKHWVPRRHPPPRHIRSAPSQAAPPQPVPTQL